MSDLVVKTQLLRETATSLSERRGELSGLERRRGQVRSAWGSDSVADAISVFVDD